MQKEIEEQVKKHYEDVKKLGKFSEWYPELNGIWDCDKNYFYQKNKHIYKLSRNKTILEQQGKEQPTPPPTKMIREGVKPTNTPITPDHYGGANNTYEAIKVIEAWGLNFSIGNVVKYISRAGKKENTTALQDLLKAKKYLEFEIAKHEALHR